MGGGASGMGGVEALLQTTIMIGKAIAGISFPGMYRIYDFHSELAPPLKNKQFVFFGFPDDEEEDEEQIPINPSQYEHLFHVTVGEDVIYIEEPLCVNESGWTPLHTCCMSLQTIDAAMKLIDVNIERGGNLDIKTKHGPGTFNAGWTCLHIASAYGIDSIVSRLVKEGANANTVNSFGYSPLLEACHRGFLSIAKTLIEGGASLSFIPTADDWSNSPFVTAPPQSPLAEASRAGFAPIAELLIHANADINQANFLGWTPLHEACFYTRIEVARLLLVSGADATVRTNLNALPYHFATHPTIREMLEEIGRESAVPKEGDIVNMLDVLSEISIPKGREIHIIKTDETATDDEEQEEEEESKGAVSLSHPQHHGHHNNLEFTHSKEKESPLIHTGGLLGDLPAFDKKTPDKVEAKKSHHHGREKEGKKKIRRPSTELAPADMPKQYICELTRKPMSDPVKSIYGSFFDNAAILSWFKTQGRICPITGMPLCETDVTPQEDLRLAIKKWLLQKSMAAAEENSEPSLVAAPKVRSKPTVGSAVSGSKDVDDMYDF